MSLREALDALFRENEMPMSDRNGVLYDTIRAALAKAEKAKDTRKPCTCHDTSRGPGRPCAVKAGRTLGELWRCVEAAEAEKAESPKAEPVFTVTPGGGVMLDRAALAASPKVRAHVAAMKNLVQKPKAEPVALSDEHWRALRESHCYDAERKYFEARHSMDCGMSHTAFADGFQRGWEAARAVLAQGGKG